MVISILWRVDAAGDSPKLTMRDAIARPRIGIVQKPRGETVGFLGERRRDRIEQLVAGRARRRAEASRCATCG